MAGGGEAVRVDEAADRGVVVAALEVIEAGLLKMEVAGKAVFERFLPARRGLLRAGILTIQTVCSRIESDGLIAPQICDA